MIDARATAEAIAEARIILAHAPHGTATTGWVTKACGSMSILISALAYGDAVIAELKARYEDLLDRAKVRAEAAESRIADLEAKLAERTRERDESDAAHFFWSWDCSPHTPAEYREARAQQLAAIERHRNKDAGSPTG